MGKESTKELIIRVAREEFFKYGYKDTSVRWIAEQADMTTGAIYGIFLNKEVLFETIVDESVQIFLNEIKKAEKLFDSDIWDDPLAALEMMKEESYHALKNFLKVYSQHEFELELAFFKSKGSKYEDTGDRLANWIARQHFKVYSRRHKREDEVIFFLIKNFCQSYIDNFFKVSEQNFTEEQIFDYLYGLILYNLCGFVGYLLNDTDNR